GAAKEAAAEQTIASVVADGAPGLARGGPVWGAGTSTSDSIWARLSTGEFVTQAKAVRYYGTSLMHAINQMRLPRHLFRRVSLGGLADRINVQMPASPLRFAVGGLVPANDRGGRPVNIIMPSGNVFPLTGTDSVIDAFHREATQKLVHRAGRKPSWFQG